MKKILLKVHLLSFGFLLFGLKPDINAQPLVHDNSFATNGVLQLQVGGPTSHYNLGLTMVVQPDDKIVFSGIYESNGVYSTIVVRRNHDGTADNSFDVDGIRIDEFVSGANSFIYDLALQPDNKIIAAGAIDLGTGQNILVARYNADGTLDPTFGSGGFIYPNLSGDDEFITTVEIQSDGKIVLGGTVLGTTNGDDLLFARLNSDGTLDNTFNTTGVLITDIANELDDVMCSALQDDGKILFGGYTYVDAMNDEDFLLVRINTDGSMDNSFGTNGIVQTPIGSYYDEILDLAIQDDGKILATGYVTSAVGANDYLDFALVRYNEDGSLDNSFDSDGIVMTYFDANSASFQEISATLAIDSDGKIIVAGSLATESQENFAMVRYNEDGSIDLTFDSDGFFLEDMGSVHEAIFQIALQADGKILALGSFETNLGVDFILARFQMGGVASINPTDNLPMFEIYPNPTNGLFKLSSLSNEPIQKIEIWNASGQIVLEQDLIGATSSSLDLSSQQNGVYLVRVICADEVHVYKILKQD